MAWWTVVNTAPMKTLLPSARQPRRSTSAQRLELLRQYDQSGLSGAAFARLHQINYTTFCVWRHQRAKAQAQVMAKSQERTSPAFVEVDVALPPRLNGRSASAELVIEWGPHARFRVQCWGQVVLAAQLLHQLHHRTSSSC